MEEKEGEREGEIKRGNIERVKQREGERERMIR